MNNRLAFIDMLRGLSILYIVGFWHLMDYTNVFPTYSNVVTLRLTVAIMGLFVFLSGYLLNSKGFELNSTSLRSFYIKRFLRIYPLYLIALIWFYFFHLSDAVTLLKAGVLISMFLGPPPPTLWFITMIMVFYLMAPFLIAASRQSLKYWLVVSLILIVMVSLSFLSPISDSRILIYFPAFVSGIYVATIKKVASKSAMFLLIIVGLFSVILSMFVKGLPERSYLSIPLATISPILIFYVSKKYGDFISKFKFFSIISYASFVMYLIHRPIYLFMKWLYLRLPKIMDDDLQIIFYLFVICLPIVIIVSFYIQKTYNNVLLVINKERVVNG